MVKVTFDYGNKEDHVLIQEMIGEPTVNVIAGPAKTLVEKVAAEKKAPVAAAPKPPAPDTPAPEVVITEKAKPIIPDSTAEPVDLSAVTHGKKTITAAEALPKVAAYCQANGLDKPQAYFARIGKANIHELAPAQIVELLTELGIEV